MPCEDSSWLGPTAKVCLRLRMFLGHGIFTKFQASQDKSITLTMVELAKLVIEYSYLSICMFYSCVEHIIDK